MNTPLSTIPLVDLRQQYATIRAEIHAAIARVLERADFILGEEVERFEAEFAHLCGTAYGIGCGSGTDALHLACRALGLGPGDEVIMPAFTFVATALGISLSGARPVLVDVDPQTALLDVQQVAPAITPRTRAIMPVHLYGQCVDMAPLRDLATRHNLFIIEDAAQAHGATYHGQPAGSLGDIGCFSFYPSKNLGAYGDGGMITTGQATIADKLRLLRNWGAREKYHHDEMGLNSRLDTIQAAILRVKQRYLEAWNRARCHLAEAYAGVLRDIQGLELTTYSAGSVFHLYVIRLEQRDAALQQLRAVGIEAGIHYPFAVHELRAYQWLGYGPGAFPVAECWARRCLSLPLYPDMPPEALPLIAHTLQRVA
jgi:dTDP-4-amino-4,6-dideoxygalactose transaminase